MPTAQGCIICCCARLAVQHSLQRPPVCYTACHASQTRTGQRYAKQTAAPADSAGPAWLPSAMPTVADNSTRTSLAASLLKGCTAVGSCCTILRPAPGSRPQERFWVCHSFCTATTHSGGLSCPSCHLALLLRRCRSLCGSRVWQCHGCDCCCLWLCCICGCPFQVGRLLLC